MCGGEGDEKVGGQQDKMRGFHFSSHAKREAEARGPSPPPTLNFRGIISGMEGEGYLLLPRSVKGGGKNVSVERGDLGARGQEGRHAISHTFCRDESGKNA